MRPLGEIVMLHVQIASLKVGEAPRRHYDPAPLRQVSRLELTADGVSGLAADGTRLPDVHHRTNPERKNRGGTNGISIGFTSHYDFMRSRFGDHLADGIAGENILIRPDQPGRIISEDDLRGDLVIDTEEGNVRLRELFVAAPCVEFARFALRFPDDLRPDRSVTEAVQFLHDGTRGFYASYAGEPAIIGAGARVFLP